MLTSSGGIMETSMGYVYWDLRTDEGMYVEIHNLYVKPEARKSGWARILLELAIKLIKKQYPETEIRIWALPKEDGVSDKMLTKFYSSLGLTVMENPKEKEREEKGK